MTIEHYFSEEIHKRLNQLEFGKVYSNPYAKSFMPVITEAKSQKRVILDFDDTLAKVKANIIVKNDGKQFTLTPAEFAVYTPKAGDVFNFNEFNKLIKDAIPIKSNIEILKKAAHDPATKTTILTARLLAFPIRHFLKKTYNLDIYVVALGNADPKLKAEYIEKEIKKGYTDIVFIDDSYKNVKAVKALQNKYPNVDLKVTHTTEAEHLKF